MIEIKGVKKMGKKYIGVEVAWLLLMASIYARGEFLSQLIYKNSINTNEKKVVLIIRDGPTNLTPEYMSVLKKYGVKNVVFCLIGKHITEKTGKYISLILENGNIICNQGYSHRRYSQFQSFSEAKDDMRKVLYAIEKYSGTKSQIAWAPYADLSFNFLKSVKSLKIPYVILPNVHTRDWEQPAIVTVKDIISQVNPGDIILLHETPETLKALPVILSDLTKKGYKIISPFEYYDATNLKGTEQADTLAKKIVFTRIDTYLK